MHIYRIALLLFSLSLSPLELYTQEEPAQEILVPPDPLKLERGWWTSYFSVEPKELEARSQLLLNRLGDVLSSLEAEDLEIAKVTIERIRLNLGALPEAKARKAELPPPTAAFRKAYTLEEYLIVSDTLRERQFAFKAQNEEFRDVLRRADIRQRHLESLFRNYESQEPVSAKRLLLGLEIISHRVALILQEERLRVGRVRLRQQEERIEELGEELKVAASQLSLQIFDSNELDSAVKAAERNVDLAQQRLLDAEAEAVRPFGDSPTQQAQQYYSNQRVIHAAVRRVSALTELAFQEARQSLYLFANGELNINRLELEVKVAEWLEHVELAQIIAREWKLSSTRERDRAAKAYALAIERNGEIDPELVNIHEQRSQEAQDTLSSIEALRDRVYNTELVIKQLRLRIGETRAPLLRLGDYLIGLLFSAWESLEVLLTYRIVLVEDVPLTPLAILRVILIIMLAYWFSHISRTALTRLQDRRDVPFEPSTLYSLERLAHYSILLLGIVIALMSVGLSLQNLAIVAGALSVGIGFGLQSIVNNFLGGLIILFERSLKVGDYIELESGCRGQVSQIWVRSTIIRTNDGLDVVVPNAEIIGTRLINWTMADIYRRMHIKFSTAYGTDKERVREIVKEAANRVPRTLKGLSKYREPEVWLVEMGASSLDFELVVWVNAYASKRYQSTYAAYLWEIETALVEANIQIPFPQLDLHVHSLPPAPNDPDCYRKSG